jgi:hypothetical protein
MTTPGDRIVRELGQLPPRDRMNVVVEVMQRLGMTTEPETGFLADAGKRWAIVGAAVLAFGMTIAVPYALEYESPPEAWLDLTTSPDDAQVLIDARPIREVLGWRIGTKAGRHLLTVMKAGYVPSDQYIDFPLNDVVRKKVTLRPAPEPR